MRSLITVIVAASILGACESGPSDEQVCAGEVDKWGCMQYLQSRRDSDLSALHQASANMQRYSQMPTIQYPSFVCGLHGCY